MSHGYARNQRRHGRNDHVWDGATQRRRDYVACVPVHQLIVQSDVTAQALAR